MSAPPRVVLCNGATLPEELSAIQGGNTLHLEYQEGKDNPRNVKVSMPNFVRSVNYVPDRLLDLLEIAVYVFLADRSTPRGSRSSVKYESWARSMHFAIRVRDFEFWSKPSVGSKLAEALCFMSGDQDYSFAFQPGHSTLPTSLFDSEEFKDRAQSTNGVVLFSGGLDSLGGVVERLETTSEQLLLVSHRSGPSIKRTQDKLVEALKSRYPDRLAHYKFDCSLSGVKAREETQRTRSFLYTSIAYALSSVLSTDKRFSIYENGITSINFPKRQDMGNSRTSRTTHPKTIALLRDFFREVEGADVEVSTPYLWKTKTDVFGVLEQFGQKDLITSSVSCGSTRRNLGRITTHCGGCSQCVDRRLGAYGAKLNGTDEGGIYAFDFIQERPEGEDRTTLVDYVRQARDFDDWNEDHFYEQKMPDLIDLTEYLPDMLENDAVDQVWNLCKRHGEQVMGALKRIQLVHDDLAHDVPKGSLLQLINDREYLKEPVLRLASDICKRLSNSIPLLFQRHRPTNENDLNDKVSGVLRDESDRFDREYPAAKFASARVVADHSLNGTNLLIESKYIRGNTSPSVATEGISADLTKYPLECHILFFVYDPEQSIRDVEEYKAGIENKGRCTVCVVR